MKQPDNLCVVMPTYNNGNTIINILERVLQFCENVIVVDDGCTDDTYKLLQQAALPVTILRHERNKGKGAALKTGFKKAIDLGFLYAITIDSDGQHYPEDIPLLVEAHQQNKDAIIVGSRNLRSDNMPSSSSFANRFSNFWFRLQTAQNVPDTQTGFRLYPLKKIKGLNILTSRYEAELELLVLSAWNNVKIISVPIKVYYPPENERITHYRPFMDFFRISLVNIVFCLGALFYALPLSIMRHLHIVSMFVLLLLLSNSLISQEVIKIWKGTQIHADYVKMSAYQLENDDNVSDDLKGTAVIVCPGGSYFWHDKNNENIKVANWLNDNGITAFVLNYTTAGFIAYATYYRYLFPVRQYPDMIMDIQRAIQLVRENADYYHINPNKIGVMGFSAGGHLVMLSGVFAEHDFLSDMGIGVDVSLVPDFIASVYPVVTMSKECTHQRSRRGLLGERNKSDITMRDSLSLEEHIPRNCPPVFLVNCTDDPVVDYHNSILLDSALIAQNIEHRYIRYDTGGHGFGASDTSGSEECHAWKGEFVKWLKSVIKNNS